MLLLHHGVCGILYQTGEHILISNTDKNEHQKVIKSTTYFCLHVHGQYCSFVKGELFFHPIEKPTHRYSSNSVVVPTSKIVIVSSMYISRKVVLYPDPKHIDAPSSYIDIDYQKPKIPLSPEDIIVPFHPVVGDIHSK